jgi:hypothetical protein
MCAMAAHLDRNTTGQKHEVGRKMETTATQLTHGGAQLCFVRENARNFHSTREFGSGVRIWPLGQPPAARRAGSRKRNALQRPLSHGTKGPHHQGWRPMEDEFLTWPPPLRTGCADAKSLAGNISLLVSLGWQSCTVVHTFKPNTLEHLEPE